MLEKLKSSHLLIPLTIGGLAVLVILMWFLVRSPVFLLVLVPLVLLGVQYKNRLWSPVRWAYAVVLIAVIVIFSIQMLRTMRGNISAPPEWDFKSFWLNGQVGIQRVNFYDAEYFSQAAAPLNPSSDFTEEIVEPGFWYPPFSILIFLLLGLFDLQPALQFWYLALSLLLIADMWLSWKLFFPKDGLWGLGAASALLLVLGATWANYFYAQTGFALLLTLILFWRDRNHPRAGIWLALAIVIKPFPAILLLYLLLQKQWRAILYMLLTLVVVSLIVIAVYGLQTFLSYNPLAKLPPIVYVEWVNQGLLATILRLTNYDFSGRSPLTQPIFLIGAFTLMAITSGLVFRLRKADNLWGIALVLLLALLVYPVTLMHYSLIMILPLLLIWTHYRTQSLWVWGSAIFITLVYVVLSINDGRYSFFAFMLCWITIAIMTYRQPYKPIPQTDSLTAAASVSS